MSTIPFLMRMKICDSQHHINLWIPVFILWLILGVLAIALAPIVLLFILILWTTGWGKFLFFLGPYLWNCLCALKKLEVDVKQNKEKVLIYFR